MSKIWLASLMLCGVAIVGCNTGGKSHDCQCGTDMAHTAKEAEKEGKEEVIDAGKVPAVVMSGFKKAYPAAKIEKIEKETYPDGTVHYEFEYKSADGKEHDVELNSEGEVLEDH